MSKTLNYIRIEPAINGFIASISMSDKDKDDGWFEEDKEVHVFTDAESLKEWIGSLNFAGQENK